MEKVAAGKVRQNRPVEILQDLRQMPVAQVRGIACTEPKGARRRASSEEVAVVNDGLRGFMSRSN